MGKLARMGGETRQFSDVAVYRSSEPPVFEPAAEPPGSVARRSPRLRVHPHPNLIQRLRELPLYEQFGRLVQVVSLRLADVEVRRDVVDSLVKAGERQVADVVDARQREVYDVHR